MQACEDLAIALTYLGDMTASNTALKEAIVQAFQVPALKEKLGKVGEFLASPDGADIIWKTVTDAGKLTTVIGLINWAFASGTNQTNNIIMALVEGLKKLQCLTEGVLRQIKEMFARFDDSLLIDVDVTKMPSVTATVTFHNEYIDRYKTNAEQNGKIAVNIDALKKARTATQDMLDTLRENIKILPKIRTSANEALSEHKQDYVRRDAKAVLDTCNNLEMYTARACEGLKRQLKMLDEAIVGYPRLEREIAASWPKYVPIDWDF